MDTTKLLRAVRSFVEFYVIGLVIIVLIEHFGRHHPWASALPHSLFLALIAGVIGAIAEFSRKNA